MRLQEIEDKLIKLSENYGGLLPAFHKAELVYTLKRAEIMMSQSITGLASQAMRDAECERLMSETKEWEEYNKLWPEMNVLNTQIRIWTQLGYLLAKRGDY